VCKDWAYNWQRLLLSSAAVIRKKYSKKLVLAISSLILIANTTNIGADIGAVAVQSNSLFRNYLLVLPAFHLQRLS